MELKSTILVVDDDPSIHETFRMGLKDEGYQLAFAANGYQALDLALSLRPDLVTLDMRMPEMDGVEVCRRIRASRLLREIPVLFVTAFGDRDMRLKAFDAGADDLISKPFDLVELRMRVRGICRLNRYRNLLLERIRFSWIVGQSSDGFLMVNEDDEIRYANPAARSWLGLLAEDVHPIRDAFLALAKQRFQCEPPDAWADWPELAVKAGSPPAMFLVRPHQATGTTTRLQVDVLDLPSSGHQVRLIRLRRAHEFATPEIAPFRAADSGDAAGDSLSPG